jgi:hypothetical protein
MKNLRDNFMSTNELFWLTPAIINHFAEMPTLSTLRQRNFPIGKTALAEALLCHPGQITS